MTSDMTEFRVVGPPGCGKTTWLGHQVHRAVDKGQNVLISSLTRAAAAEVAGRNLNIPPDNLGTLHAHCYRSLGNPEIAENRKHIAQWNKDHPSYALTLNEADKSARIDEDNMEPLAGSLLGDQLMSEYQIARARMSKNMSRKAIDFAEKWTAWKEYNGLMDFTDLIEVCYHDVDCAPGWPDVIFIDESQDLDRLEMSLIRKWGRAAGYLVVVGDPDQSIYTWRGAAPEAFTNPPIPAEYRRVLAQSYRVPRAIHATAVKWINGIEGHQPVDYYPRDHDGEIRYSDYNYNQASSILEDADQYLKKGKKVMFLTTCAYMLQPLLEYLRRNGIPWHNPHRRTNGAWNPLARRRNRSSGVERLLDFLSMSAQGSWTMDQFDNWTKNVKSKGTYTANGQGLAQMATPSGDGLMDWDDLTEILSEEAIEAALTGDVDWYQEQLKADKKTGSRFPIEVTKLHGAERLEKEPQVITGTIHSVKGSEADVVYLFPDLSKAGMREWVGSEQQRSSVYRLLYVGMTRARESLIICSPAVLGEAPDV